MLHVDSSRTGAASNAKRADPDPRKIVTSLIDNNPDAEELDLFDKFNKRMASNAKLQNAVNWYFFKNMSRLHESSVELEKNGVSTAPKAKTVQQVREERERVKKDIEQTSDEIKRRIVLLSLTMPNGREMRDCTGADMQKFGGAYQRIAEKVGKAKTVGAVLSEDQVRALMGSAAA